MTLPNFFVVGASKAGTHSLYDWLRQHPDVFMPRVKAPRYFCNHGQDDYRFRFRTLADYEALFEGVRGERAIGEATDVYMNYWSPAPRIRAAVPEARIIAILREPVQRAFSIYHMNLRVVGANEGRSFLEALAADIEIRRGYHEGLARFYAAFPRERILVLRFDDLRDDPGGTARRIFGFLGVDEGFVPDFAVANQGGVPKRKWVHRVLTHPQLRMLSNRFLPDGLVAYGKRLRSRNLAPHGMTAAEREEAYAFFHDDLLRTQALTGLDLSAWIREAPSDTAPAAAARSAAGSAGPDAPAAQAGILADLKTGA